ncbi:MAG TPA: glycosyltransferase [Actinobacteria bacterium]|nr:glycosyltransferase [Actinomycetota bacterium]
MPRAVVGRYRIARYRAASRNNVDVATDDARTWLARTPDTFRVVPAHRGPVPVGVEVVDDLAPVAPTLPDVDAVVWARVARRRFGTIVEEPLVDPVGVVATGEAIAEIGRSDGDVVAVFDGLWAAGRRLGLVPVPGRATRPVRRDPIARPSVVVCSLVPMHDVGGGSRGARLAVEFLRRGHHVTFVAAHGAMGTDLGLRFVHPDLDQRYLWDFEPSELVARARDPAMVLVEAPVSEFAAVAGKLRSAGYPVVYDVIDRWADPSLGWDWYDASVEEALVASADAVVASAPDLLPNPSAVLVPNAVDDAAFGGADADLPSDLPASEGPLIGYHGSLYGPWFDWEALRRVAEAFPDGAVVVIGDVPPDVPRLPGNVHLLGPRPQPELPAYLRRFAVGLVPFVVSEVSHAVSPLKVYEYLASGVPVAAPPLRALEGIAGVHVADDLVDAVRAALVGPPVDREQALREHSWTDRCRTILGLAGRDLDPAVERPVAVPIRPAIHWPPSERLGGGRR